MPHSQKRKGRAELLQTQKEIIIQLMGGGHKTHGGGAVWQTLEKFPSAPDWRRVQKSAETSNSCLGSSRSSSGSVTQRHCRSGKRCAFVSTHTHNATRRLFLLLLLFLGSAQISRLQAAPPLNTSVSRSSDYKGWRQKGRSYDLGSTPSCESMNERKRSRAHIFNTCRVLSLKFRLNLEEFWD